MDEKKLTFKEDLLGASRRSDDTGDAAILIVDDEKGILENYRHYLTTHPGDGLVRSARVREPPSNEPVRDAFRLLLCETGEMAIETVRLEFDAGRRIQVGFFDMKMPGGIDGLETIRGVRAIDPEIYCVIVTAYHDRSLEEIGRVFGNADHHWDYLNKPFSGNEIVQKARNGLAQWRLRRRHEQELREMAKINRKLAEQFRQQMTEMESAHSVLTMAPKNRESTDPRS